MSLSITSSAEKPGPAHNVLVKEVWGFNALVEWEPPKDDGNSEITGYSIQKADKKTMVMSIFFIAPFANL